jgi:hypothetical protein
MKGLFNIEKKISIFGRICNESNENTAAQLCTSPA